MKDRRTLVQSLFAMQPPAWTHGAHGIEVVYPTPGAVRLMVVVFGALALLVGGLTELLYRIDELPFSLLAILLDPWTIGIGAPLLLALLLSDSRSNERCVFGADSVVHETRVGRFVLARDTTPLAAVEAIEVLPSKAGFAAGWRVRGAVLPYRLGGGQSQAEAEALATVLRAWLAAPGRVAPPREGEVGFELPRLALGALAARAAAAIPLGMAAFALLAAASVWNLRDGTGLDGAVLDAEAAGELVRYRWIATLPADAAARAWLAADVHAEIGVRWRAGDGVERTLWLRTPDTVPQYSLFDLRLERLARWIGLPHIEWSLPPEAAALFGPGAAGFADLPAEAPAGLARQHAWVRELDTPLEFQAASAIATVPDWRIAYDANDPSRANLATLSRAIDAGQRGLPPWLAWLFIAGTGLPGLLFLAIGLGNARVALPLVVLVGLAMPLWAPHADGLAQRLGVANAVAGVARDLLAMGMSADAQEAASLLQPLAAPTERPGEIVLRWTAETSGTAPLLARFGLDTVAARPGAAFDATRDALAAEAGQRIAALDDAALVDLIRTIEADRTRYHALNTARVRGLCLALAQPARSANTQRWIVHGLGNPAICNPG